MGRQMSSGGKMNLAGKPAEEQYTWAEHANRSLPRQYLFWSDPPLQCDPPVLGGVPNTSSEKPRLLGDGLVNVKKRWQDEIAYPAFLEKLITRASPYPAAVRSKPTAAGSFIPLIRRKHPFSGFSFPRVANNGLTLFLQ